MAGAHIKETPIAVLGAGAWGTALALLLARNGNAVRLWSNNLEQVATMRDRRENPDFLPDFSMPESIVIAENLADCLAGVKDVLLVVPSQVFFNVLNQIKSTTDQPLRFIWGTKGLDHKGRLLYESIAEIFGDQAPAAVLAGPSFAQELAAGLPTAVSMSGHDANFLDDMMVRFHGSNLRVYKNADFIGVQLCSAVKNVIAIAVGIADGLSFGSNTRCALITRGLAEIARLNTALGGTATTLMGLSGVGDLVLTCTGNQSRNRRFGLSIGEGLSFEEAEKKIGKVIEGFRNTEQIYLLAQKLKVNMPIVEQVYNILYQHQLPKEVVTQWLNREPKLE